MKRLSLLLSLILAMGCAGGLKLEPAGGKPGDDVEALLGGMLTVSRNLGRMLDVYANPHKYKKDALTVSRNNLVPSLSVADGYIQLAERALAKDLPRTREKMMVAFAPFALPIEGRDDAAYREVATAQRQVLAHLHNLLNLKIAKKPSEESLKKRAEWEEALEEARKELQKAWKRTG